MTGILVVTLFPLVVYFLGKLIFGAARGRAFRGKVRKAMGSVEGQPIRDSKAEVTLYALEPQGGVGIEWVLNTVDSDEMVACKLSVEQARELASLLEAAAGPASDGGRVKHPGALEEI